VVYAWHLAPHYRISAEGGRGLPPAAPQDERLFLDERPAALDDPAFDEADVSDQPRYLRNLRPVSPADVVAENTARLQSLQAVDRAVGSLVTTLADQGVLDETYIVFTSDNGYSLGEHRFVGKDVLTDEVLQVPLLVRGPGVAPGSTTDLPATLVDLPVTFAALTGVSPAWQVDGTSLAPTLHGQAQSFRDTTLIQTGRTLGDGWSHRGVRTERYLYGNDGTDAFLYDRLLDPDEMVNVVDDPAYAEVRTALERRRLELVTCAGWTCNQQFGPLPGPTGGVARKPSS
jgi:arylsulfatase A-like enzyme